VGQTRVQKHRSVQKSGVVTPVRSTVLPHSERIRRGIIRGAKKRFNDQDHSGQMGRPRSSQIEEICSSWRVRKRRIRQPLDGIGLRVCTLAVCIELRLQRLLVLFAIRPVARAMGTEGYRRAGRTACLDGNIREPFGNAYRRFLHVSGAPTRLRERVSKVRKGVHGRQSRANASWNADP
jgi:hypothetical protein